MIVKKQYRWKLAEVRTDFSITKTVDKDNSNWIETWEFKELNLCLDEKAQHNERLRSCENKLPFYTLV